MASVSRSNLYIGLACVGFALVLLFVWIPLDTDSGVIEKVRRRLVVGDALAPTVAGVFILLGGIILIVFERNAKNQQSLTQPNVKFILSILCLLLLSLTFMRFTGPVLVETLNIFRAEPQEYRLLRDTVPWKYVGYFFGGSVLITGLIALVEGRFSMRALRVAVIAVIALIIIYDVPFDDLLLPPNGDV